MPQNSSRAAGRHFLQIPGPTPLPDRVLRAMDTPIIDHRGPEFAKLAKRCLDGIKTIFKTTNPVIIYTATGTGAWEAALVNTLSPGDRVLMVETGQFATQWKNMAEKLGLKPEFITGDWRTGADAGEDRRPSAQGQGARDQGGLRAAQRDRDRLPVADRPDPQGDRRRRPSGAADGRHHLVARLGRLPARRMGRRRHRRRRAEGPDAAARHVVQRHQRQGAGSGQDLEAAEVVLVVGRHADHEQGRLLPLHAGDADAAGPRRVDRHAARGRPRQRVRAPRRASARRRAARCAPGVSKSCAASRNIIRRPSPRCCCRKATTPTRSAAWRWRRSTFPTARASAPMPRNISASAISATSTTACMIGALAIDRDGAGAGRHSAQEGRRAGGDGLHRLGAFRRRARRGGVIVIPGPAASRSPEDGLRQRHGGDLVFERLPCGDRRVPALEVRQRRTIRHQLAITVGHDADRNIAVGEARRRRDRRFWRVAPPSSASRPSYSSFPLRSPRDRAFPAACGSGPKTPA